MTTTRPSQRGLTLLEIMASLVVMMIGMLGIYRVLATSIRGSSTALRYSQAQVRVQQIIEAIRTVPSVAVLNCLAASPASSWGAPGGCEAQCRTALGGNASPQACVFTTLGASGQAQDQGTQQYAVVFDAADATGPRSTFVRQTGATARVYDVQITVGWNDETGAAAVTGSDPSSRYVTMRQAVFQ